MTSRFVSNYLLLTVFLTIGTALSAQDNIPFGIHYQAVARDNYGNEIVNREISVEPVIAFGP